MEGAERALTEKSMVMAAQICSDAYCSVILSQYDDADTAYTIESKKMERKGMKEKRKKMRLSRMDSFI